MAWEALYRRFLGPLLLALVVAVVLHQVAGVGIAEPVKAGLAVLVVLLGVPFFDSANRIMAVACALLSSVALATLPDSGARLVGALSGAAFLGAFFAALGALRFVSQTSAGVMRCGAMLVERPAGQRYAALTLGAAMFSTVLNFGSLMLLGAMAKEASARQGAASPDEKAERERRMYLALLRGFGGALLTSPTTFSFTVVVAAVPGVVFSELLPLSITTALLFLALGWAFDGASAAAPRINAGIVAVVPAESAAGLSAVFTPLAILGIILSGTAAGVVLLGVSLSEGVLLALPFVALGWLCRQRGGSLRARRSFVTSRLATLLSDGFFLARQEISFVVMLGYLSAVLGALASEFIPSGGISIADRPSFLIALLVGLVVVGGQVGLNPLITVSVLAAILPQPASVGMAPSVMALALLCGWCLTAGSSPAVAGIRVIAGLGDVRVRTVTHSWNGWFTVMAAIVLYLFLLAVNLLLAT